jgi:hypothetical protein
MLANGFVPTLLTYDVRFPTDFPLAKIFDVLIDFEVKGMDGYSNGWYDYGEFKDITIEHPRNLFSTAQAISPGESWEGNMAVIGALADGEDFLLLYRWELPKYWERDDGERSGYSMVAVSPSDVEAYGEVGEVVSYMPNFAEYEFGGYEWLVLDEQGDKMLLLSKYALEEKRFHDRGAVRTWETSDVRAYLNDDFYASFSDGDRGRILLSTLDNKDNPWYPTDAGQGQTQDYVFLLSIEEVVGYFGDSGQLRERPKFDDGTDYFEINDDYNEARVGYYDSGQNSRATWWLRTISTRVGTRSAVVVGQTGIILVIGTHVGNSEWVRPAMWVSK